MKQPSSTLLTESCQKGDAYQIKYLFGLETGWRSAAKSHRIGTDLGLPGMDGMGFIPAAAIPKPDIADAGPHGVRRNFDKGLRQIKEPAGQRMRRQ